MPKKSEIDKQLELQQPEDNTSDDSAAQKAFLEEGFEPEESEDEFSFEGAEDDGVGSKPSSDSGANTPTDGTADEAGVSDGEQLEGQEDGVAAAKKTEGQEGADDTTQQPTGQEAGQEQTQQQQESTAAAAAETQQEPPHSPEQMQQLYQDWRTQAEDLLAEHHYVLDQQALQDIEDDPANIAKYVPKLCAQVYMDAVTAAMGQMLTHMPAIIRTVHEQQAVHSDTENSFFNRWPDLKQHRDRVIQIGRGFRQMNPKATAEEFIDQVGAMAMVSLRLDPTRKAGNGQANAGQVSTPPFVPAAQTPQGGAVKKQSENIFTQLDAEFEEDLDF